MSGPSAALERLPGLIEEAARLGKPEWRPMLRYTAELHARSIHPARAPFPYEWEEIGPGYCYGPAFGHWDLIHALFDSLPAEPEHVRRQILNDLAAQEENGQVPGSIYLRDEQPRWSREFGHPPVWPVIADQYAALTGSDAILAACYGPLVRQIGWFETCRQAEDGTGFFYRDILTQQWESGIDEGVRFEKAQPGPFACVDASAHMYLVYGAAARWAEVLGKPEGARFAAKAAALAEFIREKLWDAGSGWFYDIWSVSEPASRHLALEGMWPVVVGAASAEQAARVIDESLLNPRRFFTPHPLSTVGVDDPLFEMRMWRGPVWNSMTYWAALGCLRYRRADAARRLLEPALDASARQFERTGTIWEFYHPFGEPPETIRRKPHTQFNQPCRDYLGHNPLIAMARLFDRL